MTLENLIKTIKDKIKKKKISLYHIEKETGIPHPTLRLFMSKEKPPKYIKMLDAICRLLKIRITIK